MDRGKIKKFLSARAGQAIDKIIASSPGLVDVAIYNTLSDSDSGTWNVSYPKIMPLVADTTSVAIYNATIADCPLWATLDYSGYTVRAIAALEGILVVATTAGLIRYSLANNSTVIYTTASTPAIINNTVNDVAMTVLPGAPIDPLTLLPVPTIAVATAGGVSVIDGTAGMGTVVDLLIGVITSIALTPNRLWAGAVGAAVNYGPIPSIDYATASAWRTGYYNATSIPAARLTDSTKLQALADGSAIGHHTVYGLSKFKEDLTTPANGMVAYVTKSYNTGWLRGDIRRALICEAGGTTETLTATTIADRSVKASSLTVNGSLTRSPVAAGSELQCISGFSASNYLSQTDATLVDTLFAYGWQKNVSDIWEFKSGVVSTAPIDGLTIVSTVLKIEGTLPKALIRLTAGTPSIEQLAEIEATEFTLFQPGAKCTLQGTSDAVNCLNYDETTDRLLAGTGDGVTVFDGLVVDPTYYSRTGNIKAISADTDLVIAANATDAHYANLR